MATVCIHVIPLCAWYPGELRALPGVPAKFNWCVNGSFAVIERTYWQCLPDKILSWMGRSMQPGVWYKFPPMEGNRYRTMSSQPEKETPYSVQLTRPFRLWIYKGVAQPVSKSSTWCWKSQQINNVKSIENFFQCSHFFPLKRCWPSKVLPETPSVQKVAMNSERIGRKEDTILET